MALFKVKKLSEDYSFGDRYSPAYSVSYSDLSKAMKLLLKHFRGDTDIVVTRASKWNIQDLLDFAKENVKTKYGNRNFISFNRETIEYMNSLYKEMLYWRRKEDR